MAAKTKNENLKEARNAKKDEFYTQLSDIEKEIRNYKEHFKDKIVYCNCDDPRVSNFFHFFSHKFEELGLKKLITTCYKNQNMDLFSENNSDRAIYLEYNGDKKGNNVPDPNEIGIKHLNGDGDFRSKETIELLKQAEIGKVRNAKFVLSCSLRSHHKTNPSQKMAAPLFACPPAALCRTRKPHLTKEKNIDRKCRIGKIS